ETARMAAERPSPSSVSPVSNTKPPKPAPVAAAMLPSGVHEAIPDVPRHARMTIHGHIRVSVRVIVDQEGAVQAALVDQRGPSRYFERLAIEAAKQWTFPPAETRSSRLMLVRFEFTRTGTTGRAVSLEQPSARTR